MELWTIRGVNGNEYQIHLLYTHDAHFCQSYCLTFQMFGGMATALGFEMSMNDDGLHNFYNKEIDTAFYNKEPEKYNSLFGQFPKLIGWNEEAKRGIPDTDPRVQKILADPEIKRIINVYLKGKEKTILYNIFNYFR